MLNNTNFYIALFVAVLQSGCSNSYVFQKTITTFRQRPVSRVVSTLAASSAVEDTNFSSFADSLELSDDAADSKKTSSSSTVTTITKDKNVFIDINKNDDDMDEKSWQTKLEELLLPTTNLAERQILLSELLNSNEKIRDSVLDALTNRKLDPLLTPTQKKLQEGTRAVVRQLANDILPQITSSAAEVSSRRVVPPGPPDIESIGNRLFSAVTKQMQKNLEDLQDDLTDPINKIPARLEKQRGMLEKQRDEVLQEARNVFLEKPEGLEEPSYTIVQSLDLYEIRQYDAYTVASTRTSASNTDDDSNVNVNVIDDGMAAGSGFNTLASYIFGANDENKNLGMTMPVTQTSSGDMRFYISPKTIEDGRIPQPQEPDNNIDTTTTVATSTVEIVPIPSALLAVRTFRGFVTDGEVARQKDTLLQALEMDGIELDVAHGAIVPHVVFQYNSPLTLPMVRCNEIGVAVRSSDNSDNDDSPPTSESLKKEWTVDDDDEVDDSK